ncbi:MAG: Na+/H+ antiporter subunit E [Lysobacterales bacterium]
MKYSLVLILMLSALWWILSGHGEPLLLALGALSVGLCLWLALRMRAIDDDGHPLHPSWRLLVFWGFLCREILLSNLQVLRVILSPSMPLAPRLLRVRARQTSTLGRVTLANAITLTPGTVTLGIEGDELIVHALTAASAAGVIAGDLDRALPVDIEVLR